jgi:hypothetical protein
MGDVFKSFANAMSIILLIIASIMCFTKPALLLAPDSSQLYLFLGLAVFVTTFTGYHVRLVVMSNTGSLFPYYRRKQLNVLLVVIGVFSLWPVFVMSINGFPPLQALAIFTIIPALLLWGEFIFGNNALVWIGTIWLGKTLLEMMGIASKFVMFPSLFDVKIFGSAAVLPLLVSLGSMAAIYRFGRFFLKVPSVKLPRSDRDVTNSYLQYYDRTNGLSDRMTSWSMGRLLKGVKNGKRFSLFSSARLIRPALFSPKIAFVSQNLLYYTLSLVLTAGFLYLYFTLAYYDKPVTLQHYAVYLLYIYLRSGAYTSLDFLQHRHRLPALWVQLPLLSRRHFARAAALSYVTVIVLKALGISALLLVLPFLFDGLPFMPILAITAAGCVLMLLITALSLMWSGNSKSPDCRGFVIMLMVGSIVLCLPLLGSRRSFDSTPGAWYVILGLALVTLILMGLGYRKWRNTEMNFNGPEIFAPGL